MESVKVDVDVMLLALLAVPTAELELLGVVGKPDELAVAPVLSDIPVLKETPVLGLGVAYGKGAYPPNDELEAGAGGPAEEVLLASVTGEPEALLEVVCSPVLDSLLREKEPDAEPVGPT